MFELTRFEIQKSESILILAGSTLITGSRCASKRIRPTWTSQLKGHQPRSGGIRKSCPTHSDRYLEIVTDIHSGALAPVP
ncbi:MAG: hypothetical protein QOH41_2027 [Blastocatellia bacterium]|jgi:hypothetical protein|nr:hypothetical protein [Blastocatellia bacterium]